MTSNTAAQLNRVRSADITDKVDYILDYISITDLVQRYGQATDGHDFALLRTCYGEKIVVDHSPTIGMGKMTVSADKWCDLARQFHGQLDGDEHILIPQGIVIEGDEASCHVLMHASHYYRAASGSPHQNILGTYDFKFSRAADGWKIVESIQGMSWSEGNWQFHNDIQASLGSPDLA